MTLEEDGLGFDYVFKRLPTVSWYQVGLFLMSNWLFFCAGFTQVGSVILQANEDDYRCKTAADIKFELTYRTGLITNPDKCLISFTSKRLLFYTSSCFKFLQVYSLVK